MLCQAHHINRSSVRSISTLSNSIVQTNVGIICSESSRITQNQKGITPSIWKRCQMQINRKISWLTLTILFQETLLKVTTRAACFPSSSLRLNKSREWVLKRLLHLRRNNWQVQSRHLLTSLLEDLMSSCWNRRMNCQIYLLSRIPNLVVNRC